LFTSLDLKLIFTCRFEEQLAGVIKKGSDDFKYMLCDKLS